MKEKNSSFKSIFPIKDFLIEFGFLILVVIGAYVFLSSGEVDLKFASLFYHPENAENPWFEQSYFLWRFFYFAAPMLTGLFILPSLVVFVLSYIKIKFSSLRRQSLFIILIVLVGPGILINSVFKPGWGRPRPREVIELGGTKIFQSFVVPGEPRSGMSFPCGHCSVGFSTIALYFLLKRRRPKIAGISFLATTSFGLLMGVGRMADGAHFFSDVIWAGLMTYIPAFILYYKMKLYLDQPLPELNPKKATWIAVVFSIVLICAVLLATPYKLKTSEMIKENHFFLEIDEGTIEIFVDSNLETPAQLISEVQGFGFPKSGVQRTEDLEHGIRIKKHGFFTDFEAHYRLKIRPDLQKLELRITDKGGFLKPSGINPQFHFIEPGKK